MFKLRSKYHLNKRELQRSVARASMIPMQRVAVLIAREAKLSMKRGAVRMVRRKGRLRRIYVPSLPGTPPHVRTGTLRGSIFWRQYRDRAIVGLMPVGWYGVVHEFGLGKFPPRPFLRPALNKVKSQFPALFKGLKMRVRRGAV